MTNDQELRKQLVNLLEARQAHMLFEDAVKEFPEEHINTKPQGLTYSFWHLVEHIRFTQWDILDYIVNPGYQHTKWPDGYWQPRDATTDRAGWDQSAMEYYRDRAELVKIINNPETDLTAQIPHAAPGHNILREILIVGQHNAYHIGELGILRGVMDLWGSQG